MITDFDGRYRINGEYRPLAAALITKYKEIGPINADQVLFLDDTTSSGLSKGRVIYAAASSIPERWQQVIYQLTSKSYRHCITFYRKNTAGLRRNQLVALIYHELRHLAPNGGIKSHDVEDWSNMVQAFGPNWVHDNVPNLLAEEINWDHLLDPGLFQTKLSLVK